MTDLNPIDDDAFEEILWGEHEDYEDVTKETSTGSSRWHTHYTKVIKHKSSGSFFRCSYARGSTEQQEDPEGYAIVEVEPYQVVVTKYKTKN